MDLVTVSDKYVMHIDKGFTYYRFYSQARSLMGLHLYFKLLFEKDIPVLMHRVLFTHNLFREYGLVSVTKHQKVS